MLLYVLVLYHFDRSPQGGVVNFQDLLKHGNASLGRGDFAQAEAVFQKAADASSSDEERAQAHQLCGIALRLDRRFVESEAQFRIALDLAGEDSILGARITRDLGMCFLDKATLGGAATSFDRAAFLFGKSAGMLSRYSEKIEAAVSTGFIGRFYLLTGEKRSAIETFRSAQRALSGQQPTYELNNLVWLARASVKDRWRYTPKAMRLILVTGDTRRAIEYLIILLGGNTLYKKIRERR